MKDAYRRRKEKSRVDKCGYAQQMHTCSLCYSEYNPVTSSFLTAGSMFSNVHFIDKIFSNFFMMIAA